MIWNQGIYASNIFLFTIFTIAKSTGLEGVFAELQSSDWARFFESSFQYIQVPGNRLLLSNKMVFLLHENTKPINLQRFPPKST